MGKLGITYEDVAKAAQKVVGRGKQITIETVRLELGTGSNSTIGRHLKDWKGLQDPSQRAQSPDQLPEELTALTKGLWERLAQQAESKIEAFEQATKDEIVQLNEAIQHLNQENNRWQQQHTEIKQERDGLTKEKIAFEEMIKQNQIAEASWKAKEEGLIQKIAEKQGYIEELARQNKQAQRNLEHYQEAALEQRQEEQKKAEAKERELNQAIQQLRIDLEKQKEDRSILKQGLDQLTFEKGSLQAQLDKMTTHYETTSEKLIEEKQIVVQVRSENEAVKNQLGTTNKKLEGLAEDIITLKTECAIKAQEITIIKEKLEEITEHNRILAQEKWELGQEKAKILGQFKQLNQAKEA